MQSLEAKDVDPDSSDMETTRDPAEMEGRAEDNIGDEEEDQEGEEVGEYENERDDEEEDDHNYEITDFSMVTPWERFIQDVEDILKKWGLDGGKMGHGWDGDFPATREHTLLNSSKTKGVQHRSINLEYAGLKLILRHVVWLPEGQSGKTGSVCGVETIWSKRSSAATSSNYIHELGGCHGIANYLILVPDTVQKTLFLGPALTHQECTTLRSSLAIAQRNVGCIVPGFTPSGPRASPSSIADYPYTFQGLQVFFGKINRLSCYLDAQPSQETADSMRSPYGAIQYMRARHCHAEDQVLLSLRDTHYAIEHGLSKNLARPLSLPFNESIHAGKLDGKGEWQEPRAKASASDPPWGSSTAEIMDRLTVELTWTDFQEEEVPRCEKVSRTSRCGLPISRVQHMSVACQFIEELPCRLAESLERVCNLTEQTRNLSSFAEIWEVDDPIRYAFKRGMNLRETAGAKNLPIKALQDALEECLPSDPDGYTADGQCVSTYKPSNSEIAVWKDLKVKAAPPGSLLAVLARHVADETISSNLRYVAVLWSEFLNEIRWCWEQTLPIPRLPEINENHLVDMEACLIHQKLQLINLCIKKKENYSHKVDQESHSLEFDMNIIESLHRSLQDTENEQSPRKQDNAQADDDEDFHDAQESWSPACDEVKKDLPRLINFDASLKDHLEKSIFMSLQYLDQLYKDEQRQPEGVKRAVAGQRLLNVPRPLNEPHTQDHPVLTEDRLMEQQSIIEKMTSSQSPGPSTLRARLSGGLRVLKSDMSAFKAANPSSCLEDFVRWYSPRDWQPLEEDEEEKREKQQGEHADFMQVVPRGRLSARMSSNGNSWMECWNSVIPIPARKQKILFEYDKEAERALHDLEIMEPFSLLQQLQTCLFVSSFHALSVPLDPAEVPSVASTLAAIKHLLWCLEDEGRDVDKQQHDELCTAYALAERQVMKAASLFKKFGTGMGSFLDLLCTTGRASVTCELEKERVLCLLLPPGGGELGAAGEEEKLPKPEVREFVCKACGGRPGHGQQLYVRVGGDSFRIATNICSPLP